MLIRHRSHLLRMEVGNRRDTRVYRRYSRNRSPRSTGVRLSSMPLVESSSSSLVTLGGLKRLSVCCVKLFTCGFFVCVKTHNVLKRRATLSCVNSCINSISSAQKSRVFFRLALSLPFNSFLERIVIAIVVERYRYRYTRSLHGGIPRLYIFIVARRSTNSIIDANE